MKHDASSPRNQSIFTSLRTKLMAAIAALLVTALTAVAGYVYHTDKTLLLEDLNGDIATVGKFIALIAPEAIFSFDIITLDRYITQLNRDPNIRFALITNFGGLSLTTQKPDAVNEAEFVSARAGYSPIDGVDIQSFPIIGNKEPVGVLYIAVDTNPSEVILQQRFLKQMAIYLSVVIALLLIVYAIADRLFLAPIKALNTSAWALSTGKSHKHVVVKSNDELGQLGHTFNVMLDRISKEQNGLLEANQQLTQEIERRLESEKQMQLAASVFTSAKEGIIITDPEANIIDVNEAFSKITGYEKKDVIGKNPNILQSGRYDPHFYATMWRNLTTVGYWSGEIWNRHKDGEEIAELLTISEVNDNTGRVTHYVGLFSDITAQKQHQTQLEHIAHHDALTNLPNRVLLDDRLRHAMAQTQRRGSHLAVIYMDLDGFKEVNDTKGHAVGDRLLQTFASRISSTLRQGDTIARLGGDEFVAVLDDLDNEEDYETLVQRMLQEASAPFPVDKQSLTVSASIGVSLFPQDEPVDADHLLRQADQAMYQAKQAGRNRYHLFDPENDRTLRNQENQRKQIEQGLTNNEFELFYQPKVNFRTGELLGLEALIRWNHPDNGLMMPDQFLPLIEGHRLSVNLGEWVIEQALKQMVYWDTTLGQRLSVSVNINALHFEQPAFVSRLVEILGRHPSIEPSRLEIEILETSALGNLNYFSTLIDDCRDQGVSFALDDFGTGYSSLAHLKHLSVSALKVDRSFVRDILDDTGDVAIVDGIVGLAKAFQSHVIAEGVETLDHVTQLLRLGCEVGQGYCVSRPIPATVIPDWLSTWEPDPDWADVEPLAQEDRPVLYAAVEHRAWVNAIRECVDGERKAPPPMDHRECRFGIWLHDDGIRRFSKKPNFSQVENLHNQVHHLARYILDTQATGDNATAREMVQDLDRLRVNLVDEIFELLD